MFKFEGQAFNASLQAFYNAIRTNDAPAWQVRAQMTLLFPEITIEASCNRMRVTVPAKSGVGRVSAQETCCATPTDSRQRP